MPVRLPKKVNVEMARTAASNSRRMFFAVGEVWLVVDSIEKAKKIFAPTEHKYTPFGFQTNETAVREPGGEVIVPGFVAMLTTAKGFEAWKGHAEPFRLFRKYSRPLFWQHGDGTVDGL
jgi:hypothetical protein